MGLPAIDLSPRCGSGKWIGRFQGFTPLAIHFRRVAAKTNAIVGCGGDSHSEEGRRSALVVNWTYPRFCMVRGKFNTAREPLGDFLAFPSPKGTSVKSQGA